MQREGTTAIVKKYRQLVRTLKRHLMQLRMKLDNLKEAMSKN